MKKYTLMSYKDLGHLPYGFVVIDTGIFVHGALGDDHCVRILYSQDDIDLRFGFPIGVEKEAKRVLKRRYKSRGLEWVSEQLDKKFIGIDVYKYFRPRHSRWISRLQISPVDKNIIKLCLIDNAKCVVSRDLKDIIYNPKLRRVLWENYQLPKDKLFTPKEFCKKFDAELVPYALRDKLGTKWRTLKDRLSTVF